MNGVDGFLTKPSLAIDAKVMSAEGRPHDAARQTQTAETFDGHLAGLTREDGKAGESTGLDSFPALALPGQITQNFLIAALAADKARTARPEAPAIAPETRLTTGGMSTDGKALDDATDLDPPPNTSVKMPARALRQSVDGPGRGLHESHLAIKTSKAGSGECEIDPSKRMIVTEDASIKHGTEEHAAVSPAITPNQTVLGSSPPLTSSLIVPDWPAPQTVGIASPEKADPAEPTVFTDASAAAVEAAGRRVSARPLTPAPDTRGTLAEPANIPKDASGFAGLASGVVLIMEQQTHFAPAGAFASSPQAAGKRVAAEPPGQNSTPTQVFSSSKPMGEGHGIPANIPLAWPFAGSAAGKSEPDKSRLPTSAPEQTKPIPSTEAVPHAAAPKKDAFVAPVSRGSPDGEPSPAAQLAQSVAALAGPIKPSTGGVMTPPSGSTPGKASPAPFQAAAKVQILQVQLEPESLGKVTVRMRLSGPRLDLRVEAERSETMHLIGKEKDVLTGKLEAAGYILEGVVIQPVEPKAQHQPLGLTVPAKDSFAGQANGGSSHDRSPAPHDQSRSRPARPDESPDGYGARPTGGELYL